MRQLTEEEISATHDEHLETLEAIDERVEAKKAAATAFNDEIKTLHEKERGLREMLRTGQALAEQLSVTLTAENFKDSVSAVLTKV